MPQRTYGGTRTTMTIRTSSTDHLHGVSDPRVLSSQCPPFSAATQQQAEASLFRFIIFQLAATLIPPVMVASQSKALKRPHASLCISRLQVIGPSPSVVLIKASLYPLVFVELRRPRCLSKLYANRLPVVSGSLLRIHGALVPCFFVEFSLALAQWLLDILLSCSTRAISAFSQTCLETFTLEARRRSLNHIILESDEQNLHSFNSIPKTSHCLFQRVPLRICNLMDIWPSSLRLQT